MSTATSVSFGPELIFQHISIRKSEIRLLKILPLQLDSAAESLTDPTELTHTPPTNAPTSSVFCALETVSLDEDPKYLALSYTWGDASLNKSWIRIMHPDGKGPRPFQVTVNLEEALRYIRQETRSVCIWADAICIDQTNDTEKAEQVLQMRDIYAKATCCLVWLGPAEADSDKAMEALDRVGKESLGLLKLRQDEFPSRFHPRQDGSQLANQKALANLTSQRSIGFPDQALKILSDREYWTRVWIVQEIAVSSEVVFMCGSKQLSFRHFAAAIIFISFKRRAFAQTITTADLLDPIRGPEIIAMLDTSPNPVMGILVGARRRYQRETGDPETLAELLVRGCIVSSSAESDRKASRRRDRIYGFLGLASDADDLNIQPDYSKPIEECYTDVARVLIQLGDTDVLSWCQMPKRLGDLPSWVPDFSSLIREPCGGSKKAAFFAASGHRNVVCTPMGPDYGSQVLTLAGTRVDEITHTGSLWAPGLACEYDYNALGLLFSDIEEYCKMSQSLFSTVSQDSVGWAEATWRIPCADQTFDSNARRVRAPTTAINGYQEMKQRIAGSPEVVEQLQSPDCQGYAIAMEYLHNRRPFLSSEGYVGLVPAHSEPGDIVCIIYGAVVPFVLRELRNGQYQLIGEAYVHGIMDGEFMETCPTSEMFHLR